MRGASGVVVAALWAGCASVPQPETPTPPEPEVTAVDATPTVHWVGARSPVDVAVDADGFWITDLEGGLSRVLRDGSAPAVVDEGGRAGDVVVDERYVYWTILGTYSSEAGIRSYAIWRMPRAGGPPERRFEGSTHFGAMALTGSDLAWIEWGSTDGDDLSKRDASVWTQSDWDAAPRRASDGRWQGQDIVGTGTFLWFVERWTAPEPAEPSAGYWLRRGIHSAGGTTLLATLASPAGLAMDGDWIWWLDETSPPALWRLSSDMGWGEKEPERVATVTGVGEGFEVLDGVACWGGDHQHPGVVCRAADGGLHRYPPAGEKLRAVALAEGRLFALYGSPQLAGELWTASGIEVPPASKGVLVSWELP